MNGETQLVIIMLTIVLSVGPLYYRVGKLEHKICQLYKLINIKARWKK